MERVPGTGNRVKPVVFVDLYPEKAVTFSQLTGLDRDGPDNLLLVFTKRRKPLLPCIPILFAPASFPRFVRTGSWPP